MGNVQLVIRRLHKKSGKRHLANEKASREVLQHNPANPCVVLRGQELSLLASRGVQ